MQLTAPVGAVDEPATFLHEAIDPPGDVGRGVRLSRGFKLEASSVSGGRQIKRFGKPLRLVVSYDDADLAAARAPARALRLFYLNDDGTWVMIPTKVDVATKTLNATVDHFTTFGTGTLAISDDFNRPDSNTSLGTTGSGHAWQTDGSTWGICAAVACVFAPPGTGNYVRINAGVPDQEASVRIQPRAPGATTQAGLLLNVTPDWNTNLLYVGLDPAGKVEVWTLTGGNWSAGAIHSAGTAYTGGTARTLAAATSGTQLTVWVDETVVLGPVAIPAGPPDGTMAGLFVDTTEAPGSWSTLEDFLVYPGA